MWVKFEILMFTQSLVPWLTTYDSSYLIFITFVGYKRVNQNDNMEISSTRMDQKLYFATRPNKQQVNNN